MVVGSGIRKKPIPDPGVKKHPIPDPDPQHLVFQSTRDILQMGLIKVKD
jgi:hypothetical protein